MAKKKAAKKNKRVPMMGHNSEQAAIDDELRKVAKAQRSLDKEKADIKKGWRDKEKARTERLEKIGYTRAQFKEPFTRFCAIADAKDDAEVETIRQEHIIFLAQQRKAFDALGHGQQLDWVSMVQDADEIRKLREEEERAAAEAAAAGGEDAEDTPAEI